MASLVTILEQTVSTNQKELSDALQYLEQAAKNNLAEFLVGLCQVLADQTQSQVARIAAGLQVKNYLTSKDSSVKQQHQNQWISLDDTARGAIKNLVLLALGTETSRPSSAAQVIAGIACAEIPRQEWPDLIPKLVENVTSQSSTEQLKEAALEAIGYICSDMEADHLMAHSNSILTAIVHGMRKEEQNLHVKLAATNAMLETLEFSKDNFDQESERNFIMQVICEATQVEDSKIKVVALQCLVKIMSLYYKYMEAYMGPALFAITVEAMKSSQDDVCLQGIEFWSSVCEEEMDLSIELTEASETGRPPVNTSKFYAKGALQYLVPILTDILARQEELDDEDDWNPSKAAGVCIMLLANLCEDDVLPQIVPFVTANINNRDWRYRDAAVMAFGSMLEGPGTDKLTTIVDEGMLLFISLLKDESVVVRDTTAWAIGRICELIPEAVLKEQFLLPLLTAMVESLSSEPRVAANICWAFSSLAESAYEAAEAADDDDPSTYCMSGVYEKVVEKLLQTTDRSDGHQNNLRSAAYEAVMEMIKNSPKDCYDTVLKTTGVIMERIHALLQMESHIQSSSDRSHYNDLQSLLCATLQSVLRKVKEEHIAGIADNVMASLLQMLKSSSGTGGVQEDAIMAVGTLTEVVGSRFINYLPAFRDYLIAGLQNRAEYQVCIAAVGVVSDICHAIGSQILPHCDEIMTVLLTNLSDASVHRSVKPHILSVFGDICLAVGADFKKYLDVVLQMLQQAASAQVDKSDYDMVEYLNELRESCLEAYTGIIQGLKGDKEVSPDVNLVTPHIVFILSFIEIIGEDEDHTDRTVAACSGLIGDLCGTFGKICGSDLMQGIEARSAIQNLLQEGRRSNAVKTKRVAVWATQEIRKLKSNA